MQVYRMGSSAITLCIFYFLLAVASAWFDSTPLLLSCGGVIQPLSDYQAGVEVVVRDLIRWTPQSRFNYYNKYEKDNTEVYGHATCNVLLSVADCGNCLRSVNSYRISHCTFVDFAQAKFVDCEMTFDNRRFDHGGPRH
ncbi:hypothetical protein MLD38_023317 [Melastoma candidum]|uniref:Uncharacterized protein n=1 Tax=Melastoma candidum TaxID=119954 RepID=A0ACB9QMP1_9MYRT|nr:hypothetical protein MLD38_023317 [Melastoma candidum]